MRLDRPLEEVAEPVGGGYCRLQMPSSLALGVRGTVAGRRLGDLKGGWGVPPPPSNASLPPPLLPGGRVLAGSPPPPVRRLQGFQPSILFPGATTCLLLSYTRPDSANPVSTAVVTRSSSKAVGTLAHSGHRGIALASAPEAGHCVPRPCPSAAPLVASAHRDAPTRATGGVCPWAGGGGAVFQ